MAYIYKITNQINGKVYIGKTTNTIQERWREHKKDYQRRNFEKRPLYDAMNKYGIKNFIIEEVEQCPVEQLSEKEIYWINYYRSYIGFKNCNGYNATRGGDGKIYCDYEWIYSLWLEGKGNKEIQKITSYCEKTITKVLKEKGITEKERRRRSQQSYSKSVLMLDKDTEKILKFFSTLSDAEIFLGKTRSVQHIKEVAEGKRKTAYGYKWKWANN